MNLAENAYKRAGSYSKGMKQRLVFCRSLLNNPAVIPALQDISIDIGVGPGVDGKIIERLEGNEEEETGERAAALLQDAAGTMDDVVFQVKGLKGDPVPIPEYSAVFLVILSLLEVGTDAAFGMFTLSRTASLFVALPFGFIIGAFADNQMKAFALIKMLMLIFLTLPFISKFVPVNWQWIFYILPNYWMFTSLRNILVGPGYTDYLLSLLLTAGTGLIMIGIVIPKLKKGLKLR